MNRGFWPRRRCQSRLSAFQETAIVMDHVVDVKIRDNGAVVVFKLGKQIIVLECHRWRLCLVCRAQHIYAGMFSGSLDFKGQVA